MRQISLSETIHISGGVLTFDNGNVFTAPSNGIPADIYAVIDTNLQKVINGNCTVDEFFKIMNQNQYYSYLELYFENLEGEYF